MTTAPLSLHHIIRPSSLKTGKAPVMFMLHGYPMIADGITAVEWIWEQ